MLVAAGGNCSGQLLFRGDITVMFSFPLIFYFARLFSHLETMLLNGRDFGLGISIQTELENLIQMRAMC